MISGLANTEVFVVRIWDEPRNLESAEPMWRGSVEHLQTKQLKYFQSFETLVDFIARCTCIHQHE